jgi:hypothetical protein
MKQHLKHAMVVAAMAFAVSGVAQANEDNDDHKGCSNATLKGLYVFSATGFNIVGGVAQPKAIVEVIRFNGDGTLTVPAATVSINGVVTRSPANGPGTYAVAPDCTGSLAFGPPGPTFDVFVTPGGSELNMIQTGPGSPVFQGTVERVSR